MTWKMRNPSELWGGTTVRKVNGGSGAILDPTGLTADRNLAFPDVAGTIVPSAVILTSGRVPFATTSGALTDNANYTYVAATGLTIANSTASTTTSTGALVVTGGGGFGGAINAGGNIATTAGNITAVQTATSAAISVKGPTGSSTFFQLYNNSFLRNTMYINGTGSQWALQSYDGTGTLIDEPIQVPNSSGGTIVFNRPISGSSLSTADGTTYDVEKVFHTTFPDATANQKIDIRLGNINIGGLVEVTINSDFSAANALGGVTKIISVGANSGGTFFEMTSRYSEVMGPTASSFAIGDIVWDATNTTFRIQLVHRTSTGNPLYIKIRAITAYPAMITGATLSSIYTTDSTVFPLPVVGFVGPTTTFGQNATVSTLVALNGAAANFRLVSFQTAGNDRWKLGANSTAEGGSDAGSNFEIRAFTDAGSFIDAPISIARVAAGTLSIARPTNINASGSNIGNAASAVVYVGSGTGSSTFVMQGAAGSSKGVQFMTGANSRWTIASSSTAESGSDAGSNFQLAAFTDAGTFIDNPIAANRVSGGSITLGGTTNRQVIVSGTAGFIVSSSAAASSTVSGAAGNFRKFGLQTSGTKRWEISANSVAEGGSDAGSNFQIDAFTDAGASIDSPISIVRAAGGSVTVARPLIVGTTTVGGTISSNPARGPWNSQYSAIGASKCLFTDEEFATTSNTVTLYDNSAGGKVTHTREQNAAAINISTASWAANVISITTSSAHGLVVNDTVVVDGVTPSGYNGVYTVVTQGSSTTLTVANTTNPGSYTSGGTTQKPVIPNRTGWRIKILYDGTGTPGTNPSPGIGGFVQSLNAAANKVYVERFRALIPIGYTLIATANSQGTNSNTYWLTGTAGTGKYEEYIRVTQCGDVGSFSSGGHVYLTGANAVVPWYLASCATYEVQSDGVLDLINNGLTSLGPVNSSGGTIAPTSGNASLAIKAVSGSSAFVSLYNNTFQRAAFNLTTDGSNTQILSYDSTGSFLDAPVTINNASTSGLITLTRPLTVNADAVFNVLDDNGVTVSRAAATIRSIRYATAGTTRWLAYATATAEGGSDAGSNYAISAYTDAGSFIDSPLTITRASGGLVSIVRPTNISFGSDSTSATTGTLTLSGGIGINRSTTATSGAPAAIYASFTHNPGGASTASPMGASFTVTASGANPPTATYGLYMTALSSITAGTLGSQAALRVRALHNNTGTVTASYGLYIESCTNSGGGTLTTAYALRTENQTAGGTNYQLNLGTGISLLNDTTDSTSSVSAASFRTLGGIAVSKAGYFGTSVTAGTNSGTTGVFQANTAAGNNHGYQILVAGNLRWFMYADSGTESGSDAGSSFTLNAYTDAGVSIDSPIAITRASGGSIVLSRPLSVAASTGIIINSGVPGVTTNKLYNNGGTLTWNGTAVAGGATLGSNTFTGNQTAPSFINSTLDADRTAGFISQVAGNALIWGHANTQYLAGLSNFSNNGLPVISFFSYQSSSTINTLKRSSGTIIPMWFECSDTGVLSFKSAATGTIDTEITSGIVTALTLSNAGLLTVGSNIQMSNANYLQSKVVGGTTTRIAGINASDVVYFGSVDTTASGGILFNNGGTNVAAFPSAGTLTLYGSSSNINTGTTNQGINLSSGSSGAPINIGASSTGYPQIGYNLAFTGTSDTYNYKTTDTAAAINFGNGSKLSFRVAPSGTAGNPITFKEMLVLTTSAVTLGAPGLDVLVQVGSSTSTTAVETRHVVQAGGGRYVSGYTGTTARWQMILGDTTTESGSNAGANFALQAFTDAGSNIDFPINIARVAGGSMTLTRPMVLGASGGYGRIQFRNDGGSGQWQVGVASDSTSPDFIIAPKDGIIGGVNGNLQVNGQPVTLGMRFYGTTFGTGSNATTSSGIMYGTGATVQMVNLPPTTKYTISSASWSSNIVTFNTTATHDYSPNDLVVVAGCTPAGYNGTYNVLSVGGASQFNAVLASNPGSLTVAGNITRGVQMDAAASNNFSVLLTNSFTLGNPWPFSLTVSAVSTTTGVATITTSTAHGFTTGQWVQIFNVNANTSSSQWYNGLFKIQSTPSTTTFTVNNANSSGTIAANGVVAPAGAMAPGYTFNLRLVQDGTGSRAISVWGSLYAFPGGTKPTLTITAGAVDMLSGIWDGSKFLCTMNKAYS